ncbi:MAG: acetolactate synthase small subunit [Lactococcus cremoris]|jgi:acetolactate synthase-1/3 small subunit|uniref:Acetolactate synthase small subunit n=5 Tax=Lactococcus lactis subsp. cremoris TaxID=1359 RepID=A0A165G012_LACLC|nr:acetolactate synthase small subunit [Lactococcus cremoris]MCI1842250.1 acetolactate synthase small subunit [Lactococcus lactis]ADJ60275.1 acetolactate synthase 3 regulatory subunit [Lactococcus cremoris subsp. cremoris NZ9000]KEY62620.1 Acetolactate synthase small subunit [Lactococcus cremoris subsp. cremoris GE214]KKW72124.1 acetolactate synthase, small subunit, ilvN [Lactococcus cremoris]KZK06393.1 Acetolactate synthase small subunit [Lactococcus cremoris]
MRRMIIAKLHNVTGIMNRFTAVLNRRQVNIISITAGVTESQDLTHTTFVIEVDYLNEVEQIIKQLNRLIDVIEVADITDLPHVAREVVLIKVSAPPTIRAEIFTMIEPFRVNVVDVNLENVTIQLTGDSAKIEALIDVVSPYGILNMARTGSAGFERG